MRTDLQNTLGSAQALTTSGATTDYIDLGAAKKLGASKRLFMVFQITTTVAATGGANSTTFKAQCDDNTSFSSAKTVVASDAIPKASLVAGYRVVLPRPPDCDERYLRGYVAMATNDWTSGAVDCFITDEVPQWTPYANGI